MDDIDDYAPEDGELEKMTKCIYAAEADNVLSGLMDDFFDNMKDDKPELYVDGFADGISAAIDALDSLIPADVEPVKHGKIKTFSDLFGECSECEALMERGWNYCPNCGAKITGEE